mgnify:CR=1 FL=1
MADSVFKSATGDLGELSTKNRPLGTANTVLGRPDPGADHAAIHQMRLTEIDRAKGLAIILVVLGHFADADTMHFVPTWYFHFKRIIYSFHMPFFMFLSGVVVSYTLPEFSHLRDWANFVKKNFVRLMLPFFIFAIIVLIGKIILQDILYIDHPVQKPLNLILNIVILPADGPSAFIWYLYVLFEFCCICPVLLWVFNQNLWSVLLLSFAMYLIGINIKMPDFFGIDLMFRLFLFFVLGGLFIKYYTVLSEAIDNYFFLFLGLFCITLFLYSFFYVPRILTGLIAIPACLSISKIWNSKLLSLCGKYCLAIYLMHMIFIGLTKGMVLRLFNLSESSYTALFVVTSIIGICLPIFIYAFLFRYLGGSLIFRMLFGKVNSNPQCTM